MSFDTEKEILQVYEPSKRASAKCIVDADIIVPDTKPDVFNVLEVSAVASINEKYVQKEKICVSGVVDYNILYAGGDEVTEIKNIKCKVPFREQIELSGATEGMKCYAECRTTHNELKIINSRKISIKSVVSLDGGVASSKSVSAISDITADSKIPIIKSNVQVLDMTVCEQSVFGVSDEIRFPESSEEIQEILKTDIKVQCREIKTMNNKLVLKGCLVSNMLYVIDNDLYHMENETPFTEVIDAEGINSEMFTEISAVLHSAECTLCASESDRTASLDAKVEVLIKAYAQNSHEIVTDTYSPDYQMDVLRSRQNFYKVKEYFKENHTIAEPISLPETLPSIIKVHNINADVYCEEIISAEGYATLNGYFDTGILYLSDSKSYPVYCAKRKVPFSARINNPHITSGCIVDVVPTLEHCGYVLKSERDLELRAGLSVSAMVLGEENLEFVSDVSIHEETPVIKSNQPGIVIYFADEGEKMWDIAKRYSTTTEEIASINNIECDAVLKNRQQLIIPKRVVI